MILQANLTASMINEETFRIIYAKLLPRSAVESTQ
jgi:hypothetical protein